MFEPVRGGTRGGQAEFKWSDVSADKDRENYLGHSINAPTGRWQKNKDIHWYNRDSKQGERERNEEISQIKKLEAQAIAATLGYEPTIGNSNASTSGSNAAPSKSVQDSEEKEARRKEKAEKRRLKEEKRARKEQRKMRQHGGHELADISGRSRRRSSRSRSPRLRSREVKADDDKRAERYREKQRDVEMSAHRPLSIQSHRRRGH